MKITSKSANTVYFIAEKVSFPFIYDLPDGWADTVYGSWNLITGEIGISLGDYRRAEMTLFQSAPMGFEDGNYDAENKRGRDLITAKDMADLLSLLWRDLAGEAEKPM